MFWHDRPGDTDTTFLVDEARSYSYRDVFGLGDALFEGAPRSVAVLLCDRSVATVGAYFGALRRGVVPLLLDGRTKGPALVRTIGAYAPRWVLADATAAPPGYAPARQIGTKALFERIEPDDHPLHGKLALLIPTSGSTGDPKCVRLTGANIEACTRSVAAYLDMVPDRVTVSLLPFHYSYGLSVLHNTAFVRGRMVLTEQSVLERSLWQRIEDHGVTDIAGVPFTFETLRRIRLSDKILANLVCVTQAGGALAPQLTRHFWQYFTSHGVRYFTMYGQTEASPRISYVPPECALDKLGSVGIAIPGGKVSLAEDVAGSGEGELIYEGPNVSMGYAQTAADLAEGDCFGGRLYTGDQARIDEDGFVTIVGRRKRFIKLHGISVNLDHAESVLRDAGLDCRLVGKENGLVVCIANGDGESVRAALDQNFDFHPSVVRIERCESLPFTVSGKPDYATLSRRFVEAGTP
jgi:acyl-CoA synthetase (AMP-forming)/AMP-acid ligase II